MKIKSYKYSLLENSYNFLNESLRHVKKTSRNIHDWPFAIFNIIQAMELLLKHILRTHHPILIYENIDKPKNTVSINQALERLISIAKVYVDEKDKRAIHQAIKYRNLILHYEFNVNSIQYKNIYSQLFEFIHHFHHKHLKSELHNKIQRDLWGIEARLIKYFKTNFVIYNGVEVNKTHPHEIVKAQNHIGYYLNDAEYYRIKYGDEKYGDEIIPSNWADIPCHDCAVLKGQYHTDGCDVEQCPKCREQALGCGCFIEADMLVK